MAVIISAFIFAYFIYIFSYDAGVNKGKREASDKFNKELKRFGYEHLYNSRIKILEQSRNQEKIKEYDIHIQKQNNEISQLKQEQLEIQEEYELLHLKAQREKNELIELYNKKQFVMMEIEENTRKMRDDISVNERDITNIQIHIARYQHELIEKNNYLVELNGKIKDGEDILAGLRNEYKEIIVEKKQVIESKRQLTDLISEEQKLFEELKEFSKKTAEMDHYFSQSYIAGRKWLSEMIAEKFTAEDETKAKILATQKRPALKAAEELRVSAAEKRELSAKLKFLEYQLKSYQEKFPFLLDFEEEILNETLSSAEQIRRIDEEIRDDRASNYLSREEYMSLPPSSRNQLALDRYLSGSLNKAEIGRMYERYIGYLYEQKGYSVEYHGILKGFEDLGRDLICRKKGEIHIIQAKCWSDKKQIHENHICQLFGTANHFKKSHTGSEKISTFLITSTTLSDTAKDIADALGISYKEQQKLDKSYPMIKCNISRKTGEKIYHMPFDQVYDKVVIEPDEGEMYAADVFEAEFHGFRRAFKYTGLHN